MNVRKFDGSKQQFDRDRVVHTCLRNGASEEVAGKIADMIERNLYEGITTRKILELVWTHLARHHPASGDRIDLKLALSLLKPKPDFEIYAALILRDLGYFVQPNQILKGKCIEHEIDAIAQKEGRTYYVEIKHHNRMHTYTPLDVPMKVWATLQDLTEGRRLGYHDIDFSNSLILCNTRFTNHARAYADCVGINHIGWKSPNGLENIIERNGLYPVTTLKEVDRGFQRLLVENRILLLRQLLEGEANALADCLKISIRELASLRSKSRKILDLSMKKSSVQTVNLACSKTQNANHSASP